jgi:hypothetical protein
MAVKVTRASQDEGPANDRTGLLVRVRAGIGSLDAVVGVLLVVMLLPLVVGPFVLVMDFAAAGQYAEAGLIGITFTCCAALAIRAVRRGEFGPAVFGATLVLVAVLVIMAKRLPR